jgi:hypothetical protein
MVVASTSAEITANYASHWDEIIAEAAVSPLGISALAILVVGFIIPVLVRRGDSVATRIGAIILLLGFCGGLVTAAFYSGQTIYKRTQNQTGAAPSSNAPSLPSPNTPAPAPTSAPPPAASSAKIDCGTEWSGWIEISGPVGNPCHGGCARGDELGQSYRAVGFPPRPQTKHKFQCWKESVAPSIARKTASKETPASSARHAANAVPTFAPTSVGI